jgi:hypothetical protein
MWTVASRRLLRRSQPLLMCFLVCLSCSEANEAEKTLADVAAFLRNGDTR